MTKVVIEPTEYDMGLESGGMRVPGETWTSNWGCTRVKGEG